MEKHEQISIILEHTATIVQNCVADVQAGKVPPEWDGHEIKQWLADLFRWETSGLLLDGRRKRARAYRNTRAVNNLY